MAASRPAATTEVAAAVGVDEAAHNAEPAPVTASRPACEVAIFAAAFLPGPR